MSDLQLRRLKIRDFIYQEWQQGCSRKQIKDKLKTEVGELVCRATVERWVLKFRKGQSDLNDLKKTGRRATVKPASVESLIEENPIITTKEIYTVLRLGRTTVTSILNSCGLININKMWVPKNPKQELFEHRMVACRTFSQRHKEDPFLDRVIFEGERLIYYNVPANPRRNISTRDDPVPDTMVLQVWWDRQGVICYKLKESGSLTMDNYIKDELQYLLDNLKRSRPTTCSSKVIIHHNSTYHLSEVVNECIQEMDWEQIFHPKQCPDISPTNYCLFQNLQYILQLQPLCSIEDVKRVVNQFFDGERRQSIFYSSGIDELPGRWRMVLERKGGFIETNEKIVAGVNS